MIFSIAKVFTNLFTKQVYYKRFYYRKQIYDLTDVLFAGAMRLFSSFLWRNVFTAVFNYMIKWFNKG